MYIVTGAAGFIGSNIIADLEAAGLGPIVAVDHFGSDDKWRNVAKRIIAAYLLPEGLEAYLSTVKGQVKAVIHMGAISATTETNIDRLIALNINYSVMLWDWCVAQNVPFIYASSAATYGAREGLFEDDQSRAARAALRPLNAYGWSKKATDDIFAERAQTGLPTPPQWAGLKFFNVYGPNEYHKGEMKSVAAKLYDVVMEGREVGLFKSYRPDIADGEQRRDFVYIKDCTSVVRWLLADGQVSGLFNVGSGSARTFKEIAHILGAVVQKPIRIKYIEMPESIREKYQYFTSANMTKLIKAGYDAPLTSLEEGLRDYVEGYLSKADRYR